MDEPWRAVWQARRELFHSAAGDVDPNKVKTRFNERGVVTPVPAADVQAMVGRRTMDPDRVDDVLHERNGRFPHVPASAVLIVPTRLTMAARTGR